MKRYQFLYALLFAGMLCAFSFSSTKVQASNMTIELSNEDPSSPNDLQILKAAAEQTEMEFSGLVQGYQSGAVTVTEMSDNCYCVVYGTSPNDFIIIETLEED